MKRFDRSLGTAKFFLVAFFILLIPLGYYFLYHIPSKQTYYTSRNLRLLAEIGENVSHRLESYQKWLDNLTLDNNLIKTEIRTSLKEAQQNSNERMSTVDLIHNKIIPRISKTFSRRFAEVENLQVDDVSLDYISGKALQDTSFRLDPTWSHISITSSKTGDISELELLYQGFKRSHPDSLDSYDITLRAHIDLQKVIQPLLRDNVFDNILIFENDANRRVIYQQHRDEFIAVRIDTLSSRINSMFMSGYDQVTFSNSKYKLYSHPLQIKNVIDFINLDSEGKLTTAGDKTPVPMNWTIVGFVDAHRFGAESRSISHYKISLFLFIVLLILIALPLIKLKFISPLEEITKLDLVTSIFALIFGAGIITFLLITVYSNKNDERHLDNILVQMNNTVKNHLHNELDALYKQVHHISRDFGKNNNKLFNDVLSDPNTKGIVTSCMTDKRVWTFPKNEFPYFTQIAWLDPQTGRQLLKIDPDITTTPLVDVSSRDYYRKIKNKEGWSRTFLANCEVCGDSIETQYYIQPIISLTTGERTEVISFNDLHLNYIQAVSHNFMSLRDVVMPTSFGFCIVDKNGKVLFHSDDDKSLREDFLHETDNNPLLASALFSRTNAKITLSYQGQDHRLFVSPIENTDWQLITFVALSNVHSAELSAAVLSFILFLTLLLWYVLLFFVYRFVFTFKSFSWLLPHREMETCYQLYFIALFVLSGIYFTITFLVGPTVNLILAFLLPPINLMFMYLLLRYRTVCAVLTAMKTNIPRFGRYLVLIILLISTIVLFNFEKVSIAYLLFFLLITLVFLSDSVKALFERFRLPSFYASYVASIIAFLIMTSIVPTIAFFRLVYNDEMGLLIKNVQLGFTQNYEHRSDQLAEKYRGIKIYHDPQNVVKDSTAADNTVLMQNRLHTNLDIYFAPFQHSHWSTDRTTDSIQVDYDKPGILAKNLADLRRRMQIVNYHNWQLYKNVAADTSWAWTKKDGFIRLDLFPLKQNQTDLKYIASQLYPFRPPTDSQWAFGMLALILLMGVLVIYFIHKVIILDIVLPERRDAEIEPFQHNVIYIGPHGSGKSDVIDKIPNTYKINFRTMENVKEFVSDIGMGEKIPEKFKTVILDHFDVDIEDRDISTLKLKLIKRLVATYKKHVVIVSSVDPINFFENQNGIENKEEWRSAWVHALNSFTRVYHNVRSENENFRDTVLEYGTEHTNLDDLAMRQKNEDFCSTLIDECNHTPFLRQVGYEMLKRFDFDKSFFNKKAFYSEVLQRATTYYESMWHDCSIEEKITLINLVKNRFFVRKDSEFIRILLQKGLVLRDGRFRCFNSSFELFVRKAEANHDVKSWRKSNAQNWGNVRTLIFSIIIAVALFIFLTQREMFNRWVALVSTFAAGVPVILRMMSFINFSKTPKTTGSDSSGT